MREFENHEEIKTEQLTTDVFEKLLLEDYPQHSALYVLSHLNLVADGVWNREKFFAKTNKDFIKDVEQYLKRYCELRRLRRPDKQSEYIIKMEKIIDDLVAELKKSLEHRDDLRKIYRIVRRFETEAGMKMQTIPYFE
ncbi:MAG: hypothetical protein UU48_C0014G0014 [Candidatus Uhrbacteria bacterium GW2011_GWF2_41_16]|jgi:methionyl-tRNA synthetase|uniref:Uncharacterized protein n=2 Tax=Candidatus Uhriibacteriota TaxID=1752732 RepID=A0A0G0VCW3_9BACT|nr:MAG: hypothetical protein UU31_C0014G0005 [Candidatus Uhrbacteria bacterium GW2011_GWA2_41_10]KKR86663.1 MAG: hypothetical protein UU35_C0010G0041 [Candidatus Uhrbacteria bacterium GW2011_GWC2_41_11]KKR97481.1 MAG: hypothetical protein UU48_C0014G0014 [Candidatus Uhrbacteria bacterium GW2011_GWF2_41_16]HBP00148.1 hypothetical protein [Candidatus Uhrbacteria bacterium]